MTNDREWWWKGRGVEAVWHEHGVWAMCWDEENGSLEESCYAGVEPSWRCPQSLDICYQWQWGLWWLLVGWSCLNFKTTIHGSSFCTLMLCTVSSCLGFFLLCCDLIDSFNRIYLLWFWLCINAFGCSVVLCGMFLQNSLRISLLMKPSYK